MNKKCQTNETSIFEKNVTFYLDLRSLYAIVVLKNGNNNFNVNHGNNNFQMKMNRLVTPS